MNANQSPAITSTCSTNNSPASPSSIVSNPTLTQPPIPLYGSTFVRKPPQVSIELINGDRLLKWEEESGLISQVLMRLDMNGFFIQWADQNGESDLLDMSLIRDARTGRFARQPRDARQRDMLHFGSQDTQLEDKLLTIVYGTDFANVNYLNFACPSRLSSQVS